VSWGKVESLRRKKAFQEQLVGLGIAFKALQKQRTQPLFIGFHVGQNRAFGLYSVHKGSGLQVQREKLQRKPAAIVHRL
jgi:thiamine monophosphate synthase